MRRCSVSLHNLPSLAMAAGDIGCEIVSVGARASFFFVSLLSSACAYSAKSDSCVMERCIDSVTDAHKVAVLASTLPIGPLEIPGISVMSCDSTDSAIEETTVYSKKTATLLGRLPRHWPCCQCAPRGGWCAGVACRCHTRVCLQQRGCSKQSIPRLCAVERS